MRVFIITLRGLSLWSDTERFACLHHYIARSDRDRFACFHHYAAWSVTVTPPQRSTRVSTAITLRGLSSQSETEHFAFHHLAARSVSVSPIPSETSVPAQLILLHDGLQERARGKGWVARVGGMHAASGTTVSKCFGCYLGTYVVNRR